MRRDGRPLGRALLLAAVLASVGAPPAKATDDPNSLTGSCFGALTVLSADPAVVRKIGQVPDRWKLALDDHGKATLYLETPGECKMTIEGAQHTFAYTALSALLDGAALPAPEKKRDTSNAAGLPLNRWLISWSAGDAAFVRWLRKDTGLGRLVTYVPGLRYEEGSGLPHEMRFSAPAPAPSPFVLTATIVADGVMPIAPLVSDLWRETSAGSVMIETGHIDPDRFGFFKDWKLTTDPASPLGQMIGGGSASGTCTPDNLISPLPARLAGKVDSGCFTAERFLLAKWRKDIPRTAKDLPRTAIPGCTVPRLKGKTLKRAKRALKHAHCKLGKVKRPRHRRRHRRLRVVRQRPRAGKHYRPGHKVRVRLGYPRRKA
jgi:hypothetical protein